MQMSHSSAPENSDKVWVVKSCELPKSASETAVCSCEVWRIFAWGLALIFAAHFPDTNLLRDPRENAVKRTRLKKQYPKTVRKYKNKSLFYRSIYSW